MTTAQFVLGWVVIFGTVLVWEFKALFRSERGDTLSESVWNLMKTLPGAYLLVSLWSWLTWHFFIEPRFFEQLQHVVWIDDLIVVGLGLLVAPILRRKQ